MTESLHESGVTGPDSFIWIEQGPRSRLGNVWDILGQSKPRTSETWEHGDTQGENVSSFQYLTQLLPPISVAAQQKKRYSNDDI